MATQQDPLIGKLLGQYQILDVLGKGGMASVYRGYQRSVDREVAIKVLTPSLVADERLLARFEREARLVASLQHPHILTVHDFGREGDILYLVMRLMAGGSLLDELQQRGPLPVERTLKLIEQIADALDYAHSRGIIHRDLKPSNVLLDDDGNVSLTDFGIAKMVQGGQTTGLTGANAMMGTPVYMAPEQWRSEPVSPATDVYALGVIAYWMIAGQVPFSAETPHGLMYQHLNEPPEPPQRLNPSVPHAVAPVLRRALAKHPEDRYNAAGVFAADLRAAFQSPAPLHLYQDYGARDDQTLGHDTIPPQVDDERTLPPRDNRRPYGVPVQPDSVQPRASVTPNEPPRYVPPPDRPRATHSPLTSTGYTPPHSETRMMSYPERRADRVRSALYDDDPGIGRFLWVMGAVSLVVVIIAGIVLAASLLTSGGSGGEPSAAPDESPVATDVPAALRPSVTIRQPDDRSAVGLGQPVRIEFIASGANGVSEVQLRRFNQVIDRAETSGATSYQGLFIYTPDSTGPHVLEVQAWSGQIAGEPARITVFVQ